MYTNPTGLSSVPPPGPAIPVVDIATSVFASLAIPLTISFAVSSLTAPNWFNVSSFTPSLFIFASLE